MNNRYIPLGPVDDFPVIDDFTFEEVREGHCVATVAPEVCRYLVEKAELEGKKYLPLCIPCYNEDFEELLKTLISLMENFEFMQKKARLHSDAAGNSLKQEFLNTIPVIVPIFDGCKALSPTMKEWINANFPLLLTEMEGESQSGAIDVRISCSKWWYFCEDTLPEQPGIPSTAIQQESKMEMTSMGSPDDVHLQRIAQQHRMLNADGTYRGLGQLQFLNTENEEDNDKIMYFYMCPIVKKMNHRKHNSHQWFFDSICEGLEDKCTYAFLTDCGTSFMNTCMSKLYYDIFFKNDLIGVTARQRVEGPNDYFHPCEDSPFWLLQGDHTGKDPTPCWKCWASYIMSPCPLQGFELEATLILNSSMFNLAEALPVMPGSCQLLHWQKMKQFKVVDEYFNLLFEGESEKKIVPRLHESLKRMKSTKMEVITEADVAASEPNYSKVSFTEFVRVNMRLAEDRILAFVCVFSTGYGTKLVPDAIFYYQPEVRWMTLLTQRRRWLNGTFASFLFFFVSERARARIKGGLFDQHKAGKNFRLVNALWSLQLMQLFLVIITPAVFGSAGYTGLIETAKRWPEAFSWAMINVYQINAENSIRVADICLFGFFVVYALWTVMSYMADRGRMSEVLCQVLAIAGFFYMFPVYFAIWYSIGTAGVNVVGGLVIAGILLPIFIAIAESFKSAALYLMYLPWFMVFLIFYLVFVPAYAFARLWDTTWGNRATGKDSAINESAERTMKFRNAIFSTFLVFLNALLVWAFIRLFRLGSQALIAFMFIVFCPVIVQAIGAIIFLFIVLPMRKFYNRPSDQQLIARSSSGGDLENKSVKGINDFYRVTSVEKDSPINKYNSIKFGGTVSRSPSANRLDNMMETETIAVSEISTADCDHRTSLV